MFISSLLRHGDNHKAFLFIKTNILLKNSKLKIDILICIVINIHNDLLRNTFSILEKFYLDWSQLLVYNIGF